MDIATPERKKIHQGRNAKRWREIMGVTQTEVGDFLEITQQAVSKLEDKEEIDDETLAKISKKINIPVEVLRNKEPQEQMGGNMTNDIHDLHDNACGNAVQSHTHNYYHFYNCTIIPRADDEVLKNVLKQENKDQEENK